MYTAMSAKKKEKKNLHKRVKTPRQCAAAQKNIRGLTTNSSSTNIGAETRIMAGGNNPDQRNCSVTSCMDD